jgi:hypothetical protein
VILRSASSHQPLQLDIDDRAHLVPLQAVEQDDLVDAVEELRPEMPRTPPSPASRTTSLSSPLS